MMPRRIVVDASVARAAGRGEGNPPAPACIAALEAILSADLHIVMSKEVKDEWLRHRREYATKWLSQMIGRKQFQACSERWGGTERLLTEAMDLPGHGVQAVAKDVHVVGLAMVTDRRVISLDLEQRRLLSLLLSRVPELSGLYWNSPTDPGVHSWLEAGAPDNPALRLSAGQ